MSSVLLFCFQKFKKIAMDLEIKRERETIYGDYEEGERNTYIAEVKEDVNIIHDNIVPPGEFVLEEFLCDD